MKLSEALSQSMEKFGVTGTDLASSSGVSHSRLSRFLNGVAIRTDGLDKLLESLEDDAFQYLIECMIADRGFHLVAEAPPTISDTVNRLSSDETAELLNALAEKMRADDSIKKEPKKPALVTT
ncbi:MAG: helix-turn-helix transcriptional regulator [Cyanobacteria bacterium J06555_13]